MNIVIYLYSSITSNVKEQTTESHNNLDLKNYYAEWKKPKKKGLLCDSLCIMLWKMQTNSQWQKTER